MEIVTFIGIGLLGRLLPHLPNMTPIGAMALFFGAKFGMKKGLIVMLVTMLLSDLVKGLHATMWATYGSFFLAILMGKMIANRKSIGWIIGAGMTSSVLFFVLTNFAVWMAPNFMYAKNIQGLIDCYIMAIPFFRNTLAGDLIYTTVFFGGYELVSIWKKQYAFSVKV
jgi:hypothetical protein